MNEWCQSGRIISNLCLYDICLINACYGVGRGLTQSRSGRQNRSLNPPLQDAD
ncbi:hypothetical protein [Limnoraphis robusta]|uniref:hypothetical protein n=1 Tax=Limnoraphis robusta TaxID=1118279 RepID=UPI001364BA76|nr:hypothetical protein [Limnoraphis robusta]